MKFKLNTYRFFTLLLSSTLFFSCGQDSKQAKQETKTGVETVKQNASPIEKIRALNKETTALKTLEPITVSKLENWLPETVLNMKKTKGGALSQDGITGINASYLEEHPDYGKDYGKSLNILIIDGHGEQGAAAVMPFVAIKYDNINSEKSNGYIKTVIYDGTTVKEEFKSNNNTYILSFFYNNHFGVEMKLKGFEQDELWSVFKAFKLDTIN